MTPAWIPWTLYALGCAFWHIKHGAFPNPKDGALVFVGEVIAMLAWPAVIVVVLVMLTVQRMRG